MNFKENNIYSGFKLLNIENLNEIGGVGLRFEHEKTKAKLIKILSEDDNKCFAIGFRTPPENSTGVPHILEHSVLCGSRKFNTKEPFVELLKGSLNTFLNAMTYPDKTIYPVASRNEKDFMNLMDVYLDAVLYPNIYKHKEIFMQEGWHYYIENKEDELKYNGVVYNEMKGAYSSPDSILYRKIPQTIYPDTCYALSSGGDPDEIPNLTYEEFVEFHKKYYHPSNSYIFLYGNGDTEKELEFINEEYLKNFEYKEIDSEIKEQKSFESMKEESFTYGIAESEDLNHKSYYSLNFVIGDATDGEKGLAFDVLAYLLTRSTAAPLKKALIDAGIGKAVSGDFDNSTKQSAFTVLVKNAELNKEEEFKKVVMDTLKDLVKNGIDKELIEASINRVEFELREGDKPLYFVEDKNDADELIGYHVVPKGTTGATTTIVAGEVTIRGLKNGTYSLVEIKAPQGYNLLDKAESVVISNANKADIVTVENSKGIQLPSTGGIGTTIFYAAGIVVMAGAVFFVVRSRKHD